MLLPLLVSVLLEVVLLLVLPAPLLELVPALVLVFATNECGGCA